MILDFSFCVLILQEIGVFRLDIFPYKLSMIFSISPIKYGLFLSRYLDF